MAWGAQALPEGGMLYFGGDDGCLYALDIQTGQEEWKFMAGEDLFSSVSSPVISDGVVYFGSFDGYL